jgi:hypothetical protein
MTTTRTTLILTFVGVFAMSGCRDKPTCLDCEEAAADADDNDNDNDDTPMPDLPCDGADLMTDNLNCGTCGHECGLSYPGTEYEAGSCNEGVCGPGGWTDCTSGGNDPEENCSVVCISLGRTCVANGCAGLTGMMFEVIFGQGCGVPEWTPVAILSGGCDQPIPWMSTGENPRHVQCCCGYQ